MVTHVDVYPNGTVIHRRQTLVNVPVDLAYVKSRGSWYATAGHPIEYDEMLRDFSGYPTANQFNVHLPHVGNPDLWR